MDTFTKTICENTRDKNLIVYGTGAIGELVYQGLKHWRRMPDYFCDHDPNKRIFFNIEVLRPDEIKNIPNVIVIVAFKDFLRSAIKILNDYGIKEYYSALDLIELEEIKSENISLRAKEFIVRKGSYAQLVEHVEKEDWICLQHIEFMVTEKCTLQCRDCSTLAPYFYSPRNIDIVNACGMFDRVLDSIDQLVELSIMGGEPFLNEQLVYLIKNYKCNKKIGAIVIYTNGTIIPDQNLLDSLNSTKVWVHISNYGKYSSKLIELTQILKNKGINFFVRKYDLWQRAGDFSEREYTREQLKWIYSRCMKAKCYSFSNSKLYCCSRASNGAKIGSVCDTDYIDYSVYVSIKERRRQLKELMDKKYISACKYCNGLIPGREDVKPAIQIEKEIHFYNGKIIQSK